MPDEAMTTSGSTRHGYFVLQARFRAVGTEFLVSGVLENLATGDKRTFQSPEELPGLLVAWGQAGSAARTAAGSTNPQGRSGT
jgi:hypothetical protein